MSEPGPSSCSSRTSSRCAASCAPRSTPRSHQLVEAGTARDGLAQAASRNPDLILLDLGLPDGDGIEITRRLREWTTRPIIVLSARGQDADKIAALDAGADDYLTKPFSVGELLARMRVALRHAARVSGDDEEPVFEAGDAAYRPGPPAWSRCAARRSTSRRPSTGCCWSWPARRQGPDPPPPAQGGLGPRPDRAGPLSPGLHGPAPGQDRAGFRPAGVPEDRAGGRVPAARRGLRRGREAAEQQAPLRMYILRILNAERSREGPPDHRRLRRPRRAGQSPRPGVGTKERSVLA